MILDYFAKEYEGQIWELVKLADGEFVPPLSSRNSTTQGNLLQGGTVTGAGPVSYFEGLKKQEMIIYLEEGRVVGFMSYIPHHILEIQGIEEKKEVNYVSTVIVHPKCRGKRITEKMYQELIKISDVPVATITWNSNRAHIHILEKMGFELVATLKDDRGEGIDTVYYIKS